MKINDMKRMFFRGCLSYAKSKFKILVSVAQTLKPPASTLLGKNELCGRYIFSKKRSQDAGQRSLRDDS